MPIQYRPLDQCAGLCQPGLSVIIRREGIRAIDLESVSHASKRLGLSATSGYLYRLIRTGKLDAYEMGGRLMLLRSDVDVFIQSRKAG